ncbi:MAG TPA: signal peptidase I [Acidimicrobiales bacterium]|nr:signal peptidase I [Acidimicrobiales bacterium]
MTTRAPTFVPEVGADRRPKSQRSSKIWGALVTTLAVACLALLLAVVVGGVFGYRVLAIKSGSMTPTLRVGDLVVSRQIHPASAKPGEIISFRDPYLHQQLVTHRVVAMKIAGSQVRFVTKGDANAVTEHWSIPATGTIGKEELRIPFAGRWVAPLWSVTAWIIAIALVTLWIAAVALRWIWGEGGPRAHHSSRTPLSTTRTGRGTAG